MTSTENTRKYDPPPSPIHMRAQFCKISGTRLPRNANADVSFFVLNPPPSSGKITIINLSLIILGPERGYMTINLAKLIMPQTQIQS